MSIKVRLRPSGTEKFRIIGALMAAAGAVTLIVTLTEGRYAEGGFAAVNLFMAAALIVCGAMLIWIRRDMARKGIGPEGDNVPGRYVFLVTGFLFTVVFAAFIIVFILAGFTVPSFPAAIALWTSVAIFGTAGPLLLFFYFRHRTGGFSGQEIEKRERNIGAVVGGAVAALTILGLVAAGTALLVLSDKESDTLLGAALVGGPITIGGFIALVNLALRRKGRDGGGSAEGSLRGR